MIIGKESPLKKLPSILNNRQALFFDGIRYSVEMADFAYTRLTKTLWDLSNKSEQEFSMVPTFLDAWSIVDSVHRLRELLYQLPGLKKKKSYGVKIFRQKTAAVEDLRHIVQHLRKEIDSMASNNWPVWGSLSWFALLDPEEKWGRSCSMVPGRIDKGRHNVVNPVGKSLKANIDLVTLTCKEHELSLSETIRNVNSVIKGLEKSLERTFEGLPRG